MWEADDETLNSSKTYTSATKMVTSDGSVGREKFGKDIFKLKIIPMLGTGLPIASKAAIVCWTFSGLVIASQAAIRPLLLLFFCVFFGGEGGNTINNPYQTFKIGGGGGGVR